MLRRAVIIWLAILAESILVFLLRPDFVDGIGFMRGLFFALITFGFSIFISFVIEHGV